MIVYDIRLNGICMYISIHCICVSYHVFKFKVSNIHIICRLILAIPLLQSKRNQLCEFKYSIHLITKWRVYHRTKFPINQRCLNLSNILCDIDHLSLLAANHNLISLSFFFFFNFPCQSYSTYLCLWPETVCVFI